jgi:hypothetical protein
MISYIICHIKHKEGIEMKYQIYNYKQKKNVGKPYTCKKRARTRCEKLDLAYGAYSYRVIAVMENEVYYMNPFTGSVDTIDGWDCDLDSLIEVVKDESGNWVEQEYTFEKI